MSATEAPAAQNGAGQIVHNTKTVRRTNLLSQLTPAERQPFLQEELDQAAMFRQIAAARNGVPGPIQRNVIHPVETTTTRSTVTTPASDDAASVDSRAPSPITALPSQLPGPLVDHIRDVVSKAIPAVKPPGFWGTIAAGVVPALGIGTGAAGILAAGLWAWHAINKPVDTPVKTPDEQVLSILHSEGLAAPKTPLGNAILQAFEKDPSLRDRVMHEVEQTLQEPTPVDDPNE